MDSPLLRMGTRLISSCSCAALPHNPFLRIESRGFYGKNRQRAPFSALQFPKATSVGPRRFQNSNSVAMNRHFRWIAATWLDSSAEIEVDVPLSEAWDLWADQERVNRWMPWIHSIKVLKDQSQLSEWTLRYEAFGQNLEFKWIARNFQPIYHQKIHWQSVDGLPNRGAVRFYPRGPSSVVVKLTVSYEAPNILTPFHSLLSPLVENILQNDLDRFAAFAKRNRQKASNKHES